MHIVRFRNSDLQTNFVTSFCKDMFSEIINKILAREMCIHLVCILVKGLLGFPDLADYANMAVDEQGQSCIFLKFFIDHSYLL